MAGGRTILHVDMDAFYAAVEVRDNPELAGKPLIIGALPHERGVVSTCSYEARKFGVRSAMSIKEAYRRCPQGIYMHPNMRKYKQASDEVHKIWDDYTDMVEYVSLDEGYLDVTGSAHLFGGYESVARDIKRRVKERVGLTCSVGAGYSMMSAKLASEEKKPDGYFEIMTPQRLRELIIDRGVRVIYGVGEKTAETLHKSGLYTVRDLYENRRLVAHILGSHGEKILQLADGEDARAVTPYAEPKSIGKEHTFQQDITDTDYLKAALRLMARELDFELHRQGICGCTVTLKVTYFDMRSITRSRTGEATSRAGEIYEAAADMLDKIEKRPIRLIGISLGGLRQAGDRQLSLLDYDGFDKKEKIDEVMFDIKLRFGRDAVKTANELGAEKRMDADDHAPEKGGNA